SFVYLSFLDLYIPPPPRTTLFPYTTLFRSFTPNKVGKENHGYPKNMGQEADLSFGYTINKYANLVGGYSFYLNNPTVNFLKNTPEGKNYQQWAWLSLNITPTLFQAKW